MTPEKALSILENKIPHNESSKHTFNRTKIPSLPKLPFKSEMGKDASTINLDKSFIKILAIVLIVGGLIFGYLWRHDSMSEDSFKKGFNEGVASISANLRLSQNEISDQIRQINQLQHDLGKSNDNATQLQKDLVKTTHNLESMNNQKERLAKNLKETKESISGKINAVEESLENKIKRLKEEYNNKISNLKAQLSAAQRTIHDKEKQVSWLQKGMAQRADNQQELAAAQNGLKDQAYQLKELQQDLSQFKSDAVLLQQEIIKTKQDLASVTRQKEGLAQSLKEIQKSSVNQPQRNGPMTPAFSAT